MKGEVGSCSHPPISMSKKWETVRPRPTAAQSNAAARPRLNKDAAARERELHKIIAILHRWGIHTLGEFAALKKEDVSLRLGPEGVRMWERATGKATRLLKLVQPPETFVEMFEFEHEVETAEPLLFMLRRFLEQLSLRLSALYFVAKELKLRITFSDKTCYAHTFRIPDPSNNQEVLFRMLHTHLEDFQSAAPIVAVALEALPTKPAAQQFSLFESALRDPTQLSETLARLTGFLGEERVGTPVLQDTHRPDAFEMQPFVWEFSAESRPNESNPTIALRRFRTSGAAAVLLANDQPAHIRSSETAGQVVEHAGPFVASGDWWDRNAWSRAEWDVELEDGTVCRCHQHEHGWDVDGIYD
jgi:protein ImuB